MTSSLPIDFAAIPSWSTRATVVAGAPVLVWVARGTATVSLASGRWTLEADQALWLPGGQQATVLGSRGSCVLPIRVRDADRAVGSAEPFTVSVPSASHTALLAAFTRSIGVLHGGGVRAAAVLSWLGHATAPIEAPAMPTSPELRRVAERMLGAPAISAAELGAEQGLSESALGRRFRAETGWTPQRWRARHMLAVAAEQIRLHRSVAAGVAASGYGSSQAFARAFRREWGLAPSALVADAPSMLPAQRRGAELGPQRNGYHVIIWVAAGVATAGIDDMSIPLHRGDIVCLPAGASVALRAEPDAAIVPLGWLPGGLEVPPGVIARVDEQASHQLLRLAAWAYAGVSPGSGDPRLALQNALGLDEPDTVPPPVARATYALLERLSQHPEDGRTTAELAAQLGMTADELRDAVESLTGTSLASWRSRTRMAWARTLLREGLQATQVAHRIGYADAAALSRAFTRAHGSAPSHFRLSQQSPAPSAGSRSR